MLKHSNVLGGGNLITTRLVLTAAHLFWTNSNKGRVCPKAVRELESAHECHSLKKGCPEGCHRITDTSIELFFGVSDPEQDKPQSYSIT